MMKDPLTHWPDGFPYDLLAPAGITPDASLKEIRAALYGLMEQGHMTPEVRKAWDTLRRPDQRLMVDFFLYHSEAAAAFLAKLDQPGEEAAYDRTA
jgi:hypothetical protein